MFMYSHVLKYETLAFMWEGDEESSIRVMC